MSNHCDPTIFDQPCPPNPDAYPTIRNNRPIRRLPNAPTVQQQNKWESARNVKGKILGVTLLPSPGLGAIVVLQTEAHPIKNVYHITLGQFSTCTCPDFVNMAVFANWRANTCTIYTGTSARCTFMITNSFMHLAIASMN